MPEHEPPYGHIDLDNLGQQYYPSETYKPAPKQRPSLDNPFIIRNSGKPNKFIKRGVPLKLRRTLEPYDSRLTEAQRAKDRMLDIVDVPKNLEQQFLQSFGDNVSNIRDFLVTQIIPLEAALPNAIREAADMFRLITGDDTAQVEEKHFRSVIENFTKAVNLKVLDHLCSRLALDSELRERLFDHYLNPPTDKGNKSHDVFNMLLQAINARKQPQGE